MPVTAVRKPSLWLGPLAGLLCCALSYGFGLRMDAKPFNDLFAPWYAVKQFVLCREDPYSSQTTREIQRGYYGRELTSSDHRDEQRFAYPIYSVVFLWPMAFLKYETLKSIALPLLIAAMAAFAALASLLVSWPASLSGRLTLVLCVLASAPVLRGLVLEQLTILVALLVIAAMVAIQRDRLVLGGVLLAAASIKPQIALVPVLWGLMWCFSDWKTRKRLAITLILSGIGLLILSELLLPGWIPQFFELLTSYTQYTGSNSVLTMLLGPLTGLLLTAAFAAGLVVTLLRARHSKPEAWEFNFATAYALGFVAIAMPAVAALHNQILLLPAFCLFLRSLDWPKRGWLEAAIAGFSPVMAVAIATAHSPDFLLGPRVAFWMCLPIAVMAVLTYQSLSGNHQAPLAQRQYL